MLWLPTVSVGDPATKRQLPFKSWKNKVIVISDITKDDLSKSKVYPCGVCSLRVKVNSALCAQCSKWIHGRYVGVEMVTPNILINFKCRKCEENIGEAVEHEEKSCDEVETVREFAYPEDMVMGHWWM